jgi:hypothetical protein
MSQSLRSKSKIKNKKSKIFYTLISRRALIRSSTGGWVIKSFMNQFVLSFPLNGEAMYK